MQMRPSGVNAAKQEARMLLRKPTVTTKKDTLKMTNNQTLSSLLARWISTLLLHVLSRDWFAQFFVLV